MDINKRLYFLHIPKTGGTSVSVQLHAAFVENSITHYPPTPPPHNDNFNEYVFIQGHLGRYPIDKTDNLDVACLLRDPLDRAISNFLFIYNKVISKSEVYSAIPEFIDKLKYYFFDDLGYIRHRNIQAQFICNSPATNIFKDSISNSSTEYKIRSQAWGLQEQEFTLEMAKAYLDKFAIVNTIENHEQFLQDIKKWFLDNYSITIGEYTNNKMINTSLVTYNEVEYTTTVLKSMLSEEDIQRFLELNSIDFELYEHVYNKKKE